MSQKKFCPIFEKKALKKSPLELANLAHQSNCADTQCSRCTYIRNEANWRKTATIMHKSFHIKISDLPVSERARAGGSWLANRVDESGEWGAGCICCEAFCIDSDTKSTPQDSRALSKFTSKSLRFSGVKRHHFMESHVAAARQYLGIKDGEGVNDTCKAPSKDDFLKVWSRIADRGDAPSAGIEGIGGGKKVIKMVKCTAEGIRHRDRQFMSKAVRFSLQRDERTRKMAAHYTAMSPQLDYRYGLLGSIRGSADSPGDASASAITAQTHSIFDRFATPKVNLCPPETICIDDNLLWGKNGRVRKNGER